MLNCTEVSTTASTCGTTPFCFMTYSSVISGTPPLRPPMTVAPRRSSQEKLPPVRPTRNEPSRLVSWAKITGWSSLP